MSPAHAAVNRRPLAAEHSRRGSPIRWARTRASDVRATDHSSSDGTASGRETWLRTRTMVTSSPLCSATAIASSARSLRRSSGLPIVSSEHNMASRSARSGRSAGSRARASSRTSTLSLSMVSTVLNVPRSLARVAATSRSMSPPSTACRAASRRVSRNAGISCLTLGGSKSNTEIEPERLIRDRPRVHRDRAPASSNGARRQEPSSSTLHRRLAASIRSPSSGPRAAWH